MVRGTAVSYCVVSLMLHILSFYRATACNVTYDIIVAILSVCRSDACILTKLNNSLRIFWYHTKGQSLHILPTPTVVCGWCPLPSEIFAESDPPHSKKHWLRQVSTYNVSTVRDSEKSSIVANRHSTGSFPTSYRWSAYVTPKPQNGWPKKRFFRFKKLMSASIE